MASPTVARRAASNDEAYPVPGIPTPPSEAESKDLFTEVASADFLGFSFGGRAYAAQLEDATKKTGGAVCAVHVGEEVLNGETRVVMIKHDFSFMGGSLGCAEGERITRGFEHAAASGLPVVVQCKTGGARMQEGALSLMQAPFPTENSPAPWHLWPHTLCRSHPCALLRRPRIAFRS